MWYFLAGTAVSVLIAWIVIIIQRKDRKPRYAIRNTCLIENATATVPNLGVHYKGHAEDVDSVSVARIVVWNGGKASIKKTDVPTTDQFRITAKEPAKILGATVIQANHVHSNCHVAFNKQANRVNLTFDFLDYRHGFEVEVVHTGTSAAALEVSGSVVEGGPLASTPPHHVWGQKPYPGLWLLVLILGGTAESTFRLITGIRTGARPPVPVYEHDGRVLIEAPPGSSVVELDGQKVLQPNMEITYFIAVVFFTTLALLVFIRLWKLSRSTYLPVGLNLGDSKVKTAPAPTSASPTA